MLRILSYNLRLKFPDDVVDDDDNDDDDDDR